MVLWIISSSFVLLVACRRRCPEAAAAKNLESLTAIQERVFLRGWRQALPALPEVFDLTIPMEESNDKK